MNKVTLAKTVSCVLGGFLLVCIVGICLLSSGCSYTRNAPLFSNQIEINDSANGNAVTPIP